MYLISVIILSFVPAFCWTVYCIAKRIPFTFVFVFICAACMAVMLCAGGQQIPALFFSSPLLYPFYWVSYQTAAGIHLLITVFWFACVEEIVKMYSIRFSVSYLQKRYNAAGALVYPRMHNAIVHLSILFGLAFGGVETIFYGIRYTASILLRLLSAVLLHGMITAYYLPFTAENKKMYASFGISVILHSFYNIFSAIGGTFTLLAAAILVLCAKTVVTALRKPCTVQIFDCKTKP